MIVSLRDPEHDDALAEVVVGERIGIERGTVLSLIAALVDSLQEDHERNYNSSDDGIMSRLERESFLLAVLVQQVADSDEGWSALLEETGRRAYGPYPERRAAEDAARARNTAYTTLRATLKGAQDAFYVAFREGRDAQATASATTGDDTGNTATAKE